MPERDVGVHGALVVRGDQDHGGTGLPRLHDKSIDNAVGSHLVAVAAAKLIVTNLPGDGSRNARPCKGEQRVGRGTSREIRSRLALERAQNPLLILLADQVHDALVDLQGGELIISDADLHVYERVFCAVGQ